MLHAFDARTGVEVWAYVPFNLLPKLRALRDGQPVGSFKYFVDSSAKVADVKIGGTWRTYLMFGQGPGGTFYQTLDVTLTGHGVSAVPRTATTRRRCCRSSASRIASRTCGASRRWTSFDASLTPYGDIGSARRASRRRWARRGRIPPSARSRSARRATGSPWSGRASCPYRREAGAEPPRHRRPARRSTSSRWQTAPLLDSRNVGNDGVAETVDNCAVANDCRRMKNALQADPVATGPPEHALHHEGVHRRSRRPRVAVQPGPRRVGHARSSPSAGRSSCSTRRTRTRSSRRWRR